MAIPNLLLMSSGQAGDMEKVWDRFSWATYIFNNFAKCFPDEKSGSTLILCFAFEKLNQAEKYVKQFRIFLAGE